MGYGGVVRDSSEQWVHGFFGGCNGGSPLLAKLLALKASLEMTWDCGQRMVICETDCKEIVDTDRAREYNPLSCSCLRVSRD